MTAMDQWQSLAQTPELLGFFEGLFDRMGVRVADTGEEFSCTQRVGRIEMEPGLKSDVDFVVEITTEQVERLAAEAETGRLSDVEKYRVLRAMLGTPLEFSASLMNNRLLSSPVMRKVLRVVDIAHIFFISPSSEEPDETFTLALRDGRWELETGLQGTPQRTIRLDIESTLDFHRRTLAFRRKSNPVAALRYVAWYVPWRRRVTTRARG